MLTVQPGDTVNTISNRYGVPSSAILAANGLSAGQVTAGRRIVIPVYSLGGAARRQARAPEPEPRARPVAEAAPPPARVVATSKIAEPRPERTRSAEAEQQSRHVRPGRPDKAAASREERHETNRVAAAEPTTAASWPIASP